MRNPGSTQRRKAGLGALADAAAAATASEANAGKGGKKATTARQQTTTTTGKENGSAPAMGAKPRPPHVTAQQRKAVPEADEEAVKQAAKERNHLFKAVTWLYNYPTATTASYVVAHGSNVSIEEAGPLARSLRKGLSTIPGVSYSLERAVLVRPPSAQQRSCVFFRFVAVATASSGDGN